MEEEAAVLEEAMVVEDTALVVAMELVLEELLTTTDVAVVALVDAVLPEVMEVVAVVAEAAEPVAEPEPEAVAAVDEAWAAKKTEQSLAAALWALSRSLGEQLVVRQPATRGSSLAWFFGLHWQAWSVRAQPILGMALSKQGVYENEGGCQISSCWIFGPLEGAEEHECDGRSLRHTWAHRRSPARRQGRRRRRGQRWSSLLRLFAASGLAAGS